MTTRIHPLVAIALLLGLAGTTQAQDGPPPSPVVVDKVRTLALGQAAPMTGTVHTRNELMVTAGATGRLLWIAQPGQRVEAGDTIARIDATPLKLQRDEQQALLRRQQTNLAYLNKALERREQLGDSDYVSEIDLEQARAQRDLAIGDIEVARARLRQLEDQIARTEVTAPFAGIVTMQQNFAGEEVSRGQQLARLVDTSAIEVRTALPLRYYAKLRTGDVLKVHGGDETLIGSLRTLIGAGDAASQTFEARINLPDGANRKLAIGQLVTVELPFDGRIRALAVPRDALILRRDGNYVFRVADDGTAQRMPVTIGTGQGDWITVDGALADGDRVIVRGGERLQPGARVDVLRDLAAEEPEQVSALMS